ncbi:MAG: hypothetical protein AAFV53_07945 [Myxococcota bacterium]
MRQIMLTTHHSAVLHGWVSEETYQRLIAETHGEQFAGTYQIHQVCLVLQWENQGMPALAGFGPTKAKAKLSARAPMHTIAGRTLTGVWTLTEDACRDWDDRS